jgi:hypothetical protein
MGTTKRLPEGKRVRTIDMGYAAVLVTSTVVLDGVGVSHVFQDDVTIIGYQLAHEWLVDDTDSNTDGSINSILELSRQGQRSQPGLMGRIHQHSVWNAAIVIGNGDLRKQQLYMFPEGYGIEVDEGEGINLLYFLEYIGGGGPVSTYGNAIIYYVER